MRDDVRDEVIEGLVLDIIKLQDRSKSWMVIAFLFGAVIGQVVEITWGRLDD